MNDRFVTTSTTTGLSTHLMGKSADQIMEAHLCRATNSSSNSTRAVAWPNHQFDEQSPLNLRLRVARSGQMGLA
jgi:hypothetical protein